MPDTEFPTWFEWMKDISLEIKNVSLAFRIFGTGSQSLKKELIHLGTGGKLCSDTKNHYFVQALNNVSFSLNEGDRLGILGPNGAGKSTLLRVLAGIYQPQSGEFECNGRRVAIIDPSVAIDPNSTGYENIYARAILQEIERGKISEFTRKVKGISELGDYLSLPVHTYSTGMVMRLNFALSVSIEPDILLLDEWLSVTDQLFNDKAERYMADLIERSKILVLSSHNMELLSRVCNFGILLDGGSVLFSGTMNETIAFYQNRFSK